MRYVKMSSLGSHKGQVFEIGLFVSFTACTKIHHSVSVALDISIKGVEFGPFNIGTVIEQLLCVCVNC